MRRAVARVMRKTRLSAADLLSQHYLRGYLRGLWDTQQRDVATWKAQFDAPIRQVLHFYQMGAPDQQLQPGRFMFKLIDAINAADAENRARLAEGFETYVCLVCLVDYLPSGADQLLVLAA